MKKYVVLKPTGPMRLANATFKIKQGQVAIMPPFPVDENVFDIFDGPDEKKNLKAALEQADKNVQMKNIATREGITDTKTLAKVMAKNAKGPTAEDRESARKKAKVLTQEGIVDPGADAAEELAALKAQNEALEAKLEKLEGKKEDINPKAYLDQNSRTAVKAVKQAATKGQLKKKDVATIIDAENKGLKRKTVLNKLKHMIKEDVIFGKLFK